MKRNRIFMGSLVGFVGALLFWTVAQAQSDDVARGKIMFIKYCTGCHGPEGEADGYRFLSGPDPANLTLPSTRNKSDVDLLKTIHEGKPNMPPWKPRFSEKESREVLAYVRTLAKGKR